jgi:hypothetical protein
VSWFSTRKKAVASEKRCPAVKRKQEEQFEQAEAWGDQVRGRRSIWCKRHEFSFKGSMQGSIALEALYVGEDGCFFRR